MITDYRNPDESVNRKDVPNEHSTSNQRHMDVAATSYCMDSNTTSLKRHMSVFTCSD